MIISTTTNTKLEENNRCSAARVTTSNTVMPDSRIEFTHEGKTFVLQTITVREGHRTEGIGGTVIPGSWMHHSHIVKAITADYSVGNAEELELRVKPGDIRRVLGPEAERALTGLGC